MNPTANPLGAGGDVTKAAQKISALLKPQEPQGQPAQESAPVQANPTEPVKPQERAEKPRDPVTKRFVKAEPQTAEEQQPEPEAEQPKVEAKAEAKAEPADDTEELAEYLEDFAKQLGIDQETLLDHLKAPVKVNGEERRVTLKELRDGYSMEADYRQKTAKHAEERRAFEAQLQQYTQQREQLSQQLQPLVQQLEQVVATDQQRLDELLNAGDLVEYERVKRDAEKRAANLIMAQRQQARLDAEKQVEARNKLEQEVMENERLLVSAHPDWAKDTDKGKRELADIRQYLKAEGVRPEQVDSLYDAKSLLIAEKAMKYDKLLRETKDKVVMAKQAPLRFQKPGPSKAAEDPQKQAVRASLQRLRRTGDYRDAAKAMKAAKLV